MPCNLINTSQSRKSDSKRQKAILALKMIQSNMTSKQSKVIVKPAKVNISATKVANALLSSQISNNSAVEIS